VLRVFKEKFLISIVFITICLIILYVYFRPERYKFKFYIMNSAFDIEIVHIPYLINMESLKSDISEMLDQEYFNISLWEAKSEITKINRNAGIKAVKIDNKVFNLLNRAKEISLLLRGEFSIFFEKSSQRLLSGDFALLDQENNTFYLEKKDSYVDLKNISNGYLLYNIIEILRDYGIHNAYISSSGGIAAVLGKNRFKAWMIENKVGSIKNLRATGKKDFYVLNAFNDLIAISSDPFVLDAIKSLLQGLEKRKWQGFFNSFRELHFLYYDEKGNKQISSKFNNYLEEIK
jgi:thiamine biosynthesis lipoprotein ApbE